MRSKSNSRHVLSYLPVFCIGLVFVATLVGYEACICFWALCLQRKKVLFGVLVGLVGGLFWILAFWSYLVSCSIDPGKVPANWEDEIERRHLQKSIKTRDWSPYVSQFCDICESYRPARAHHCYICGTCILKMDHHCVWINNCLGYYNMKSFCLFIFWNSMAGILFATISFYALFPTISSSFQISVSGTSPLETSDTILIMLGLLTAVTGASIGVACFLHLVFLLCGIAKNVTSIEQNYSGPNPYDRNLKSNFREVFGPNLITWLFPVPIIPTDPGIYSFDLSSHQEAMPLLQ